MQCPLLAAVQAHLVQGPCDYEASMVVASTRIPAEHDISPSKKRRALNLAAEGFVPSHALELNEEHTLSDSDATDVESPGELASAAQQDETEPFKANLQEGIQMIRDHVNSRMLILKKTSVLRTSMLRTSFLGWKQGLCNTNLAERERTWGRHSWTTWKRTCFLATMACANSVTPTRLKLLRSLRFVTRWRRECI